MTDELDKADFAITDSEESFDTWLNRPYLSGELRQQLRKADVLIVPIEGFREISNPVFPVGTESLYDFLSKNIPQNINIDICIDDSNYAELALHSDLHRIGSFVVKRLVLPFLITLLVNYISQELSIDEKDRVKVSITVVNEEGGSKTLDYEGPANKFGDTVNGAKPLWED